MESTEYNRFRSGETEMTEHLDSSSSTPNPQNRRIFIMFGILSLFLLTLTLAMGIKFTQVSQQVSDLMESLDAVSTSSKMFQKVSSSYPEPITPVRGPCEDEWTFFKGKCYFVSKLKKNWEDAKKNCVQRNAHLLVVNDAEEQDYISQVVETNANYWIGLVEREEGTWTWVDGTDYSKTEHFWDDGQPDNWEVRVNGEDCGQLHARTMVTNRPWNDADCSLPYKYVCEGPPRRHSAQTV